MRKLLTGIWLWRVVFAGVLIQLVHFYMHGVQAWHWLAVDRATAYMTPEGWRISSWLGSLIYPSMCGPMAMMVGMEWMHLILNVVFVGTLLLALWLAPSKWLRWALAVELAHLGEHIGLTATMMLYGQDYGWSNLFGYAVVWFGHNAGVGYKVLWHFLINFAPTGFMLWGMREYFKRKPALIRLENVRLSYPAFQRREWRDRAY